MTKSIDRACHCAGLSSRLASTVLSALVILSLLHTSSGAAQAENPSREQARTSPGWLRSSVVYEIFPRNFSAAGNFKGITERLDELNALGVNILWIMPVHPTGKEKSKGTLGSPYAVRDYYAINPAYGTEADLKELVKAAHQRGMKVIIDIVANHTAWDSVMMAHPEFYKHDAAGNIIPPEPGWGDVAGLNYGNPKLRQYMIAMLKHWIDPAGAGLDGFRCDVAFAVPTSFWDEAREALSKVKPDVIMLAEASSPDLMLKAFDMDYAWPMLHTMNDVLANSAPATDFQKTWEEQRRKFPQGALHLDISDDHDEARAVAKYGLKGALAASVLMFTLDGVPLLYNGMEAGDATESGDPALFEKMPVFWQSRERPPLRAIYRDLIKLRRENPAFQNDQVTWLKNSCDADVVSLMRSDGTNEFLALINFSNRPLDGKVDAAEGDGFEQVFPKGNQHGVKLPSFALKGFEYRIYQRKK